MFAPRYFPNSYFAPRYFAGAEAAVSASRGDGVPIWIGVPSPPLIPTLSMVGPPVRIPTHERESVRVSLGTLHTRVVHETLVAHIREYAAIGLWDQHVGVEQQRSLRYHAISDSMLEAMSKTAVGWGERRTAELIEAFVGIGSEAGSSKRTRRIRNDHETAQIPLTFQVQAHSSLTTRHKEQAVLPWATSAQSAVGSQQSAVRESYAVRTVYKLTHRRALSADEVAAIAIAAMAVFDEAA